ncbi:MAG: Gfo/Idh/MocA family oxidoreductase [Clostridia bacterium]|nr:Gfo/Idh/MocA family oxidoreductase [Clostridia bacterium]
MQKHRIGIIGCGGIANGKHMPSIKKLGDCEMVAFCDLIEERAKKAAKDFGTSDAKVYTDYRELLADSTIDSVRVLTQNRCHCEITVAALEAGKHVLVEKPMCITPREAKLMLDARDRSGKLLAVGYQFKFSNEAQYVRAETEAGNFGEIYFGKCRSLRRRGVPTWGVFTQKEEQGAGPLFDIGTHALDMMLYVMDNYEPRMVVGSMYDKMKDEPRCANPFGEWDVDKFDVETSAFAFITMKNGATIILECSWLLNTLEGYGPKFLLAGTKAGADTFTGKLLVNTVKHNRQTVEEPDFKAGGIAFYDGVSVDQNYLEQRNFIDAVLGKAELVNTADRAAVVTNILAAIKESSESGKPVYFD